MNQMAKYTFYIVSRGADDHYPVLLANNGKIPFNEPVRRAAGLSESIGRFLKASREFDVAVVRISHADFRKRFPRFARNAGRRKAR